MSDVTVKAFHGHNDVGLDRDDNKRDRCHERQKTDENKIDILPLEWVAARRVALPSVKHHQHEEGDVPAMTEGPVFEVENCRIC